MNSKTDFIYVCAAFSDQDETNEESAWAVALQRRYGELIESSGSSMAVALELLGGEDLFDQAPRSLLECHSLVSEGLPAAAIFHLANAVHGISHASISDAIGISLRSFHRKKSAKYEVMNASQGGRALKLAEIVAKACSVLGDKEEAVRWLTSPAIGLNQQRPIDLLSTPTGTELVEDLLGRIEYGVYA